MLWLGGRASESLCPGSLIRHLYENAEVLSVTGEVIPRLYASGNNSGIGGPGLFYNGAGGTLGPGFTFGYIAGMNAAQLTPWE